MDKSEAFWDSAADNYDKTEERFESIHKKSRESARKHLHTSHTVLDYGCGTGTTACELASSVKQISAIDLSSKMIQLAQEKVAAAKIENISLRQGDIFDEDYKAGSFDVILAFNMLHTVPEPEAVMQRIRELLKPEGLIIAVTPTLRDKLSFLVGLQIKLMLVLCSLGIIPIPIRRLKSPDLDGLVENARFQIVDSEKIYAGASSYFVVGRNSAQT